MTSISILGCGWLGHPLAIELIASGYQVKGSTTQQEKLSLLERGGIEPYHLKFTSSVEGELGDFFKSEVLIVTIPPKRKSGQTDIYLQQIKSIAEAVVGYQVKKLLFISSTSVYPDVNRVVNEEDADPLHYLVQAEDIVKKLSPTRTTILRFGGLIGPGRHPGKFLSGKKDIKGANTPVNIIHLDDCVGVIKTLLKQDIWGEIFNACSDKHPAKKEFYTAASAELDSEPPHFSEEENIPYKIVSNAKIKARTGYRFIY
ncbi:SDR family oxidoreductase [Chryseosolibacter indicus]|uniref:SDR family oxidoreductase n=1 Tax=Chryseosolibacter indicus TaxID=2782351 RepID=A0ABS5VLB6_9BACT|nr:SDR family oxidoreductase [Chryseosolibacter indicus]MBT1702227.1 SDR family oxidoreductase [Chryseosolibacter indicus]